MESKIRIDTISALVERTGIRGQSLISINDLSNEQIYSLFELGRALEPWNRSGLSLLSGNVLAALFFQPSTRTRMSFETAMVRLGGAVITETTPLISSSMAKEETLADMLKVVSKYANIIVLRHPNADEARAGVQYAECPVINGGFGDWEHPTQALLDLYTLWRTYGRVEGLTVCIATPDMVAARTGHSMAYGLARLGARVILASTRQYRAPAEVMRTLEEVGGDVQQVFDLNQDTFNDLVADVHLVYLPGCSAPKGAASEEFKKLMDDFFVRYETLKRVQDEQGRIVYVTHTLPRRPGEMDLRIDESPSQLYFNAITHSVSIRMALVAAMIGV